MKALPLASVRRRIYAAVLDYGLYFVGSVAYIYTVIVPDPGSRYLLIAAKALPLVFFWILYFPVVEGGFGRTLGKALLGLTVVQSSGEDVTIRLALQRRIIDVFDFYGFGIPAMLAVAHTSMKQRLGDFWAGTCVIRTETVSCPNCGESVTLEGQEVIDRQFRCPECDEEVSV